MIRTHIDDVANSLVFQMLEDPKLLKEHAYAGKIRATLYVRKPADVLQSKILAEWGHSQCGRKLRLPFDGDIDALGNSLVEEMLHFQESLLAGFNQVLKHETADLAVVERIGHVFSDEAADAEYLDQLTSFAHQIFAARLKS